VPISSLWVGNIKGFRFIYYLILRRLYIFGSGVVVAVVPLFGMLAYFGC
jgi:hypothetical protein